MSQKVGSCADAYTGWLCKGGWLASELRTPSTHHLNTYAVSHFDHLGLSAAPVLHCDAMLMARGPVTL